MYRALFLSLLAAVLFLTPRAAEAQQSEAGLQPKAAGVTMPLARPDPASAAQRGMAPDSILYDDGNAVPDDVIGFGDVVPFYAATRFTAGSSFTLLGARVAYRTEFSSAPLLIEVYDDAAGPNNPTGGTLLFSGTANAPSQDGHLTGFNFGAPVGPFAAGESFFIVVGFSGVTYPMGADTRGTGNYTGRGFFSGTGSAGDWTALGDVLQNGQDDMWVLRALGENGGGGGQAPDINVTPSSLSASLSPGASTTLDLTIGNTGAGSLTWSAAATASRPGGAQREPAVAVLYASRPATSDFAALREVVQDRGEVAVIVGLSTAFRPEGEFDRADGAERQRQRIAGEGEALLGRLAAFGVQNVKRFETVPYVAMTVDAAALAALEADPGVYAVYEDAWLAPSLAESTGIVGAPAAWQQGFAGAGQAVAVLDTGVDTGHPFFGGRTVAEACFSTNGPGVQSTCPNGQGQQTGPGAAAACSPGIDGCDHGTHVAGIAMGRGSSFSGVARDASLIAVQVFSILTDPQACGGQSACVRTAQSDQIRGLEYVYSQRGNVAIASANMSLGGGRFSSDCDASPLKPIIDNLRSAGIATVIASGNDGYTDAIGEPACISSAIAVGSTGDGSGGSMADAVSDFSNSSPSLDLLAPGNSITSSVTGGGFGPKGGTSMAAPHIAGAWAVLKGQRPQASVTEIFNAIASTGVPITDPGNGLTHPRLQLDAALGQGGGGGSWLSASPPSGTTAPGATSTVTVRLDASSLGAGTHNGTILITSNDPDEASVSVPVTLTVGGGGGGGGTVLTHIREGDTQNTITAQTGGYVHGTNGYDDTGKAVAFAVPGGGSGQLAGVSVRFSARAATPVIASYTLRVYGGTPASGPQGAPLFSQTYSLADMNVDGDPNTPSPPTEHVFSAPVAVDGSFFVAVEYQTPYGAEDFNIASTAALGAASGFEWERWSDGSWNNMSDAWFQGSDGWHMWISAHMGNFVDTEAEGGVAEAVALAPSYPNPFASSTSVRYALPRPAEARLDVFDALGRRVATLAEGVQAAGDHEATWSADGLASGVYVLRLSAGGTVETQRVTLVR
ncbi:MAG: S8 family serine peptidase [Bacteroidota bacterium]